MSLSAIPIKLDDSKVDLPLCFYGIIDPVYRVVDRFIALFYDICGIDVSGKQFSLVNTGESGELFLKFISY